jgi:hypothetical protein
MGSERDLQLIALGICMASKAALNATDPKQFSDMAMEVAVADMKKTPEGVPQTLSMLLTGLGCNVGDDKPTAAVLRRIGVYSRFKKAADAVTKLAGGGKINRGNSESGQEQYLAELKHLLQSLEL